MGRSIEGQSIGLRDPGDFRVFYRDALPRVYGYFLNRNGRDTSIAEDLTQETFMSAVKELKKNPVIDDPFSWILGIARHKLVDHYRRREREERRMEAVASEARTEDSIHWESFEASGPHAIESLERVGGPQRTVLVLRYIDGLSVPEVSHLIGKSIHATESLLMRAKQSFRRNYEESGDA